MEKTSCLEGSLGNFSTPLLLVVSTLSEFGKMESFTIRHGRDFRAQEKQVGVVAGKAGCRRGCDERNRSQKVEKTLRNSFGGGERGHMPRNADSFQKLEKARNKISPRAFRRSIALPTP